MKQYDMLFTLKRIALRDKMYLYYYIKRNNNRIISDIWVVLYEFTLGEDI